MAKLKNVTIAEMQVARAATDDPIGMMQDLAHRMETGYCDTIDDPLALVRHFHAVSRSASDLVSVLLFQIARQEQERQLADLRKKAQA